MPDSTSELKREQALTTITRRGGTYRGALTLGALFAALIALLVSFITFPSNVPSGIATHRDSLGLLIRGSWAVVGFAAAVGVASAGIIQVGKQLFGVRALFQRAWVTDWIESRSAVLPLWEDWVERSVRQKLPGAVGTSASDLADAQGALAAIELQEALLGGMSEPEFQRVFDFPVEQLCAQIGSAADLALSRPQDYAELLLALSGPVRLKEIDLLAPPTGIRDGRIIRGEGGDNVAYAVLAQAVRAGIDMMQVSVGQRWQRGVRGSAVIISGLLGVAAAFLLQGSATAQVLYAGAALVVGGFFAWVIRDVVAIVERARR